MRFKVLTVVTVQIVGFWIVTPRNMLSASPYTRKMRAVYSTEMLVAEHKTTWCQDPQTQ